MWGVYIKSKGKSHLATIKGLDERSFLEYEERNDARNKATEIRLAMAYMTNAGVKYDSEVDVKEIS